MATLGTPTADESGDAQDRVTGFAPPAGGPGTEPTVAPGTTGRYLVLLREGATEAGVKTLRSSAGLSVAHAADFTGAAAAGASGADAIVFDRLGVAVVSAPPDQVHGLHAAAAGDSAIQAIEPERVVYAIQDGFPGIGAVPSPPPPAPAGTPGAGFDGAYLRGYRDAVNHLVDTLLSGGERTDATLAFGVGDAAPGEAQLTWGLQATGVARSRFTGRGIRVAVLDTGIDLGHPDFVGRQGASQSFVPEGEPVQDLHGHGTHCAGTACGPRQPGRLPRYGVAGDAGLYVGKVLNNRGNGTDEGILAGIDWALANGCQVISMSLGAPVFPGQGFSPFFEQVAKRALAAGSLIIAAAGNDSGRPGFISPVSHPANCPSIMAVGALDSWLRMGAFSNGGINLQGGQVDIAGPGVAVLSAWPRPFLYHSLNGTSMAAPHVAGIAALYAEADPSARGLALATLLMQRARRLQLPSRDVGVGLVQAP